MAQKQTKQQLWVKIVVFAVIGALLLVGLIGIFELFRPKKDQRSGGHSLPPAIYRGIENSDLT